ncbi:3-keto-5-aminohexanoate cleavage protein [Deinococcus koreensis]|uniref:3-keto-5-aminohexanoate cleavage protein n=1 Tax=Deinococcus koreensis TaxID=2054903 RepID=A0A2K3UVF4_9DEIO|nr:3-keto-5-aminohexanoate cleavage protein [Deinococcus koreensis]PNY80511.1 hypothetical protein CVO96_03245 [Deinococcus koreensis]
MRLKACLNGSREPGAHPQLPLTPGQLARAAADAVVAGAQALHLHPRGSDGLESLQAADVAAALRAVRAACPGVPVGISSGFWILPDVAAQLRAAQRWGELEQAGRPDFVSVNVHEPHARALAGTLLQSGIGVEAGLWTPDAVDTFLSWLERHRALRVLVELPDEPEAVTAPQAAAMLGRLEAAALNLPTLLHGLGRSAWPMVSEAGRRGLSTRIGLEDTLSLPDGSAAPDNAGLVRSALAVLASAR